MLILKGGGSIDEAASGGDGVNGDSIIGAWPNGDLVIGDPLDVLDLWDRCLATTTITQYQLHYHIGHPFLKLL